jgi:sulfane dehydrogenase subunit SoxC
VVKPHRRRRQAGYGVARSRQQRRHERHRQGAWVPVCAGPEVGDHPPVGGQRLPGKGFYEITGLAWTGGGIVRKVDVSVDGGRTYKEAQLQAPVLPYAHTRFRFGWEWNGEDALLQSRCTDERGEVQPTIAEAAKILGVTPEYFLQADHFNGIQPWRVNPDGTIHSATY